MLRCVALGVLAVVGIQFVTSRTDDSRASEQPGISAQTPTAASEEPSKEPSSEDPTTEPPSPEPTQQPTEPANPTMPRPPSAPAGVPVGSPASLPAATGTGALGRVQRLDLHTRAIIPAGQGCPRLLRPMPLGATYRSWTTAYLRCVQRGWAPVFAAMGEPPSTPPVLYHTGTINTPCGAVKNRKVSFYCSANETIYVHTALANESNRWWRLRVAETLHHEFFHHVQHSTGVFRAYGVVTQGTMPDVEFSRRIELQAMCVAMRQIAVTPGLGFKSSDLGVARQWFTKAKQDAEHGDQRSNLFWGMQGFSAATMASCNTWVVPANRVS